MAKSGQNGTFNPIIIGIVLFFNSWEGSMGSGHFFNRKQTTRNLNQTGSNQNSLRTPYIVNKKGWKLSSPDRSAYRPTIQETDRPTERSPPPNFLQYEQTSMVYIRVKLSLRPAHLFAKSTKVPTNQRTNQPKETDGPTTQSINQGTDRPTNQRTNQPTNQSTHQQTNQDTDQRTEYPPSSCSV